MNEARKKVEDFKNSAAPGELRKITWGVKLPENHKSLDYHAQRRAETIAIDEAIAQRFGVTLTDVETWPDEQANLAAKEWAAQLPDK